METFTCYACLQVLQRADRCPGSNNRCYPCRRKSERQWRLQHPRDRAKVNAQATLARRLVRLEALVAYGGNPPKCTCCGEAELAFLAIDHINNDGAKWRKKGLRGNTLYYYLRHNGYPPGLQILCHNCNQAKSDYGTCPHRNTEWRLDIC